MEKERPAQRFQYASGAWQAERKKKAKTGRGRSKQVLSHSKCRQNRTRNTRAAAEKPNKQSTEEGQCEHNIRNVTKINQAQLFQIKDLNKQELLTAVFPEILHDTRLTEPPPSTKKPPPCLFQRKQQENIEAKINELRGMQRERKAKYRQREIKTGALTY